jgi:hypothetical protein
MKPPEDARADETVQAQENTEVKTEKRVSPKTRKKKAEK